MTVSSFNLHYVYFKLKFEDINRQFCGTFFFLGKEVGVCRNIENMKPNLEVLKSRGKNSCVTWKSVADPGVAEKGMG